MSRYLVTGATGFLGSHLVAALTTAGHDVVALCRKRDASLAEGVVPRLDGAIEGTIHVRLGDVLDAASVRDAAAGCDGAFHCAGRVSRDPADAEILYRLHVDGTKVTLDALRAAGVARVVVASTSGTVAVSRDPDRIATEDDEPPMDLIARWPYYRSKLFAERAALEKSGDGFAVISVNPSLLLGPGDLRGSSTEDVKTFLERKVPATPGGGMAFVDARDAAAAMILAMHRGGAGQRYLVNAANMTLTAFFARLERLSGVKAPPLTLPRTSAAVAGAGVELMARLAERFGARLPVDRISAEMAQHFWYCDASRAKQELGWDHRDPGETLADTVDDLRTRGVVWPSGAP
jgi:dihydroflavonol-4-reductase